MSKDFIERPRKNEKDGAIAYVQELLKQAREDRRNDDVDKLENLIRLLNTKKYGLVWEEHAELVEEEMKTKIPVFVEDETKKIMGNPDSEDYNFLLEGDNLHSLHLLKKTHAGKIDVIYIDPPYNRGKTDFKYNDLFVDKLDSFRHSKWLSFMSSRLRLAHDLLKKDGLIFVSIDDYEFSQLKLLIDSIFGEENFVNTFVWKRNSSGKTEKDKFTVNTEYVLLYSKTRDFTLNPAYKPLSEATMKSYNKDDKDGRGRYASVSLQKPRDPGPETSYDYVDNSGKIWKCPAKGWRMTYDKVKALENDNRLITSGKTLRVKDYWSERPSEGKRIDTLWSDLPENTTGSKELDNALREKGKFDNPKPTKLIERCLQISKKEAVVLDFFAGSGTTGHAVAQLNKEDGGNRKYILCTNNENNICEEVTYKRLSNIQEEIPHNLKYFKTDFVVKEEFPDVTLEYELLNYVTPLVELEFGVDISNPKVQVILSEGQMDEMDESDFVENSTLFFHPDIFFDAKQESILREKNITKQEIPHYYFGKDIWS
ncbi:site-specific DNA-methyltransferase [Streptococcus anginosus]|uniref:site-specific DNA-methyltransferase n=1 Tax=Streptococcus anginosus TaxID=1328 RepID=UPI0021F892D4|nr:site-specific DNA-methyltransferase [Streptococcus anginosus]MCW0994104.1 site-specific DNA-methyltransferase [Streptococcus anginosus]MCW1024862.1 site-specific DNA-methyltransferase [Streptococcus anginosus]